MIDSPKYLSDRINDFQPRSILKKHDVLTNIVGASIGRTCEYTLDCLANTNQAVAIIRPIEIKIARYIANCLNSTYCINLMFDNQVDMARANLSLSSLSKFLIPIPPCCEIDRVTTCIQKSFKLIEHIEYSKGDIFNSIRSIKSKILDLAIRGKLVPQNPNDEPASVLLERIRAEKEELIKQGKIKRDKKESVIFKGEDNSYYEKIGKTIVDINDEMLFDCSDNCILVRLKDVCQLISGRDLKPNEYNNTNKGIPYLIGASNFINGNIEINRWTDVPQVISKQNDLLITCKGTIGEMSINTLGDAHIARQIMAIRNIYNLNISYIAMCISFYIQHIKAAAKGLIPGISRDDILIIVDRVKVLYDVLSNIEQDIT